MKPKITYLLGAVSMWLMSHHQADAQITKLKDFENKYSKAIGEYQGITFREAGFSGLFTIPNTNGKEFWTVSDRGVNIDAANANTSPCKPTYDKIYAFPNYAPKIHRIKIEGDSIRILQTISIKRPDGKTATGIINPTGFGSKETELASIDTVNSCGVDNVNFLAKTVAKDAWGIDSEGIAVDKEGNFWLCEEGGPTIWKLNKSGVVINRYTPYANLLGSEVQDILIDTVYKYRKNNRGFEGITIAPNGKVYAIIQSPLLYPTTVIGEASRVHRILEIDPVTNATRMFAYLNDGVIGASGSNQIRLKDWKIGDLTAINDSTFLVLEAAARGTSDIKRLYKININAATEVNSGLYNTLTLEALKDSTGLANNSIVPVQKTLVMDLLANQWPAALDKAEGISIINDSTIAICNDNDYGQMSTLENGIATATNKTSHLVLFGLGGNDKLTNFVQPNSPLASSITGPGSSEMPYLKTNIKDASFTSFLTVGDAAPNNYKLTGVADGTGAFDNGDGTFTLLVAHEVRTTDGVVRKHGQNGAFISKWIINKADLSVVSGSDLIENVNIYDKTNKSYRVVNTANPDVLGKINRFCSADLPSVSAFYNDKTGKGTQERIFMSGEEAGAEGRLFANIVTGANAGNSYELPFLGKFSWENALASPQSSDKTVIIGTDDATPGQVYVYVGEKTNAGNEIEKAGLSNGKLFGVSVNGLSTESSSSIPSAETGFSLVDIGAIVDSTGAQLESISKNKGVTTFLRPEDGAWDPNSPNDFYFATTNSFSSPSRLWRLRFADAINPEAGGTITAVLDGSEGQKMMDNLTIDKYGHILIQEDPGNQSHLAAVWQYDINTDNLIKLAEHDSLRFISGSDSYLTQDEESSGIIDMQDILGPGHFLLTDQAHYTIPGELVEGGQLLTFFNPYTFNSRSEISVLANNNEIIDGNNIVSTSDNTDFEKTIINQNVSKVFTIKNDGPGSLKIDDIQIAGVNASEFSLEHNPKFPLIVQAGKQVNFSIKFTPLNTGKRNAKVLVKNNDFNEGDFDFVISGYGNGNGNMGASSSQSPYLITNIKDASFTSFLTVGDAAPNNYKLTGVADGTGAFDNGDGTFTLLVAHEVRTTDGVVRKHGQNGAFISKWIINKADLSVVSGSDLIENVNIYDKTNKSYRVVNTANPDVLGKINRFCSADLPSVSAFYNDKTGKGTQERIFMSGEEAGAEGRLFANIVTGANAGNSYELPFLGKFSWENALASPQSSDKTVIIGTDDATPGQVYVYVGEKTNAGNEIEKAGLSNGKLFGVSVNGLSTESSSSIPSAETGFSLVDIGAIVDSTGAQLESISKNKGVTTFLRPEDGAWDPNSPNDFYFATTNSFSSPSRLWRLRFADAINPEAGGTITAVLDGSEGQKMMDNLTIDKYGHILIQEDPGNQSHLAAVWQYDINTDNLIKIAEHDASRFVNNSQTGYLTQDEESSGIIDMHDILGPGHFLLTDQAHYTIPGELVEGGQLLTFFNPDTISNKLFAEVKTTNESVCGANDGIGIVEVKGGVKPFTYQWTKNKQIVPTNSNLSHGIDTVIITDKIGNKFHATAKVGYNALPNVEFEKTDVLCYNGFGSVKIKSNEVLNAYNFNWSNLKNGLNNDSVKAGIIGVTGINGECKITGFVTVTEPSKIMAKAEVIEAIACFGDTAKIKLSASGGIAPYSLDGDTLVKSGKHSFVAIDANGCVSDSVYAVISEPSKLIANAQIAQAIKCNGETAKIQINSTGGLSPYEVKGNLTVSSGRHSYVSVDANGCNSDSVYIDVTEPSKILAKAELTEAIKCYGGEAKIDVTAQGGVAPYSVKGNTTVKSGQHSYFVVDANGCNSELALIEVSQPAKLVGKAELSSEIKCFGDTAKIKLAASGGSSPYSFNGDTLVKSGIYKYFVVDSKGCKADTFQISVSQPEKLEIKTSVIDATNDKNADGKAIVITNGGHTPYSYQWDKLNEKSEIATVGKGVYKVTVIDAKGCKINADLTVGAGTLGVNNLEISGLSIYPNPTSGQVFISFNSISESKVELVDISGKVINSDSSNGSVNVSFDLSELSSGVYFIKIQNMDGVFIQKLMKN